LPEIRFGDCRLDQDADWAHTFDNIREFPKLARGARVINLEQNYRSSNPILKACNDVINLSKHGYRKNCGQRDQISAGRS
jgi:superfamily I DNA/RNA helicase